MSTKLTTEKLATEQIAHHEFPMEKPEKSIPSPNLTSRELEILNLIFSGRASGEVAELLCVSKRTVDFHLSKAYSKLGVKNRVQAFRKASELGITGRG